VSVQHQDQDVGHLGETSQSIDLAPEHQIWNSASAAVRFGISVWSPCYSLFIILMSVVHAANALPRHHGRRWVCSQGCCLGSTIRHLQWQQTGVTEVSSFSLPVPRCAQCPAMKFHKKERLGLFTPWKHSAGTKGTENAENAGTQNIQTYPQKIAIPSDLMRDSLSDAPDSASQDHHHCSGVILGKGTKRVNLGTTWNHLKPLGFKDNSLCCLMFNLLSLMISWCLRAGCLRGVRQRRQPCLQHRRGECRHPTNDVIFWCVSNQTLSNSDFFWSTALWVAVLVQTS
jgi:hypothetical protein